MVKLVARLNSLLLAHLSLHFYHIKSNRSEARQPGLPILSGLYLYGK